MCSTVLLYGPSKYWRLSIPTVHIKCYAVVILCFFIGAVLLTILSGALLVVIQIIFPMDLCCAHVTISHTLQFFLALELR